ncbi:MAG: 2,3-bisphosphoglycerate-independent phosphoglycerate mutase [Alphaproteobacteria bacterium]|jgi:2,3-bisphosphoglycerate-independent phosphoglycerate mutase
MSKMTFTPRQRPVVLCVMDGWGWRDDDQDNAIRLAETPNFDRLWRDMPHALLDTSGIDVGLPGGQMGNSEVGHLNLGAGRIVDQDIRRIDAAIEDNSLPSNAILAEFIDRLKASGGACHLMGLISPGGVHSHLDQIAALAGIVSAAGVQVSIHAFLDGRDTPPRSADGFMKTFLGALDGMPGVTIQTVTGRFYAMDRDQRWERVAQAYETIVSAAGERVVDAVTAIEASYAADIGDEFVLPTVIGNYAGMNDGDGILMGNFRSDRAREILTALLDPAFEGFERSKTVSIASAAGLVEYSDTLAGWMDAIFPLVTLEAIFPEIIAEAGLRQFRIAETEKYAHVTFFFNGGVETPYPGEDRALIPSPKVRTYDLQPEMSAHEVTDRLVEAIGSGRYDFIFVNYANPDMVGHTGILSAAITAIETVDSCLGRLEHAIRGAGGALLITADHGNAETMTDPETGDPMTSHTTNVVPVILTSTADAECPIRNGRLADVAPTLLELMGLERPKQMTGRSLLVKNTSSERQEAETASA